MAEYCFLLNILCLKVYLVSSDLKKTFAHILSGSRSAFWQTPEEPGLFWPTFHWRPGFNTELPRRLSAGPPLQFHPDWTPTGAGSDAGLASTGLPVGLEAVLVLKGKASASVSGSPAVFSLSHLFGIDPAINSGKSKIAL